MFFLVLKILSHSISEKLFRSKPVTRKDIPTSYSAINREWLTDVLCDGTPGARVIGFTFISGDSGSTDRQPLHVTYNQQGVEANLPAELFMKGAMKFATRMAAGATNTFRSECHFYNTIRPNLRIEAPSPVYANYDPVNYDGIVIMENVAVSKGATFCNPCTTHVDFSHARQMIETIAGFHGHYFNQSDHDDLRSLPLWEDCFSQIAKIAMIKTYGYKGVRAAEPVVPENIFNRAKEIWPATLKANQVGRDTQRTLTHGDIHIKNWYITDQDRMGLSDWQTCARGPFTRDLAYAISCALCIEDRRNWEEELIKYYITLIRENTGVKLNFDAAYLSYSQQMLSALALWTPTLTPPPVLPDMQPKEVSMEYIKRITHAMDDLKTLDRFD